MKRLEFNWIKLNFLCTYLLFDYNSPFCLHVDSGGCCFGGNMFFVDGPGGTGKSFLFNVILIKIRSEIIENGITAHSKFKIPLDIIFLHATISISRSYSFN